MKQRAFLLFSALFSILVVSVLLSITQTIKASPEIRLRPPFDGTYRVTSYFDHESPRYCTGADGYIWIYNGERVTSSCIDHTGTPYPYGGHDGWDFSMDTGTDVLAAADGTVVVADPGDWRLYGRTIVIDHGNNYYTQYSHLSNLLVAFNDHVSAGQHIAESGSSSTPSAHLHFTVSYGGYNLTTYTTDPFGWRGAQRDPLVSYTGRESSCLWRSADQDPVSCADTIIEDAGQGSTMTGAWEVSVKGNGYRTYYHATTTDNSVNSIWSMTRTIKGIYKIYAFIPEQPPGVATPKTQQAQYSIWQDDGWQTRTIDQSAYTNQWVLLGTFTVTVGYPQVILHANTGEAAGTRLVMADAIKFRSYLDFLPLVRKDPTPTPSPTPTFTPTPVPTATPLPTPTPTRPPVAQCGQNALLNPGFESGLPGTPWTKYSSGGYPLISTAWPHTGSWGTWLGGYNNALDRLYQGFTLPSGVTWARVTFWWYVASQDSSTTPYDYLNVVMQSPPGNDLTGRNQVKNTDARGAWYQSVFDVTQLGPWAGSPQWFTIEVTNDGSLPTSFYVDDVSYVVYCSGVSSLGNVPASPLATPTPHH